MSPTFVITTSDTGEAAMSYAGDRRILDADSHLMELPGFLDPYIEPELVERLRGREMEALAAVLDQAVARAEARRTGAAKAPQAAQRPAGQHGGMGRRARRCTRVGCPWVPSTPRGAAASSICWGSGASWCSRPSPPPSSWAATS